MPSAAVAEFSGATTVANNAALQVIGAITSPESITLNGTGISGAGALRKTGTGTATMSGPFTLASASRINSDDGTLTITGVIGGGNTNLTVGGVGNTTINGAIQTGSGQVIKDGAGTLTLGGNSNYTGVTTINAGVLAVTSPTAWAPRPATRQSPHGAALQVSGAITIPEPIVLNGTGIAGAGALRKTGADTTTMSGAVTLARRRPESTPTPGRWRSRARSGWERTALTIGGAGATTLGGVITGSGTLTKDGAGVLTVTANNDASFTGPITVTAGVVSIPASTALGTDRSRDAQRRHASAHRILRNAPQHDAGHRPGREQRDDRDHRRRRSAHLRRRDRAEREALTKAGAGTLILTGNNTYGGGTIVNAGRLLVNGQVDPNSGTGTGAVQVNSGATVAGTGRTAGGILVARRWENPRRRCQHGRYADDQRRPVPGR